MTLEMFAATEERLSLRDADVSYYRSLPLGEAPEVILQRLVDETEWRSESIVLWGRRMTQPRLIAWHGDSGSAYTYSGLTLQPAPWTPFLTDLRRVVETRCGTTFNSVLLNYYRDERDSMGFHSDDEPELGPEPTIASVSFGGPRVFVMKHRTDKSQDPMRLELASGSLLVMRGETQRYWSHGVPKRARHCDARVNLTFRTILP